jgi:hypothetical protein
VNKSSFGDAGGKPEDTFLGWATLTALGLVLLICSYICSSKSANNDVFQQLLAIDGIRDLGKYGYSTPDGFVSISERPTSTRWPPGMTLLGVLSASVGLDPLLTFSRFQVLLLPGAYLIWAFALRSQFGLVAASVLSFASLTGLNTIVAFSEVSSEPYALVCAQVMFAMVVGLLKGPNATVWVNIAVFVPAAIAMTFFRTSGVYVVAPLCVTIAYFAGSGWIRRMFLVCGVTLVSLAPILAFHSLSGRGILQMPETYSALPQLNPVSEFIGNLCYFSETILPSIGAIPVQSPVRMVTGVLILLSVSLYCLYMIWDRRDGLSVVDRVRKNGVGVPLIAILVATAYAVLLGVSAAKYGYSWKATPRVAAFPVPWVILAFGSMCVLVSRGRVRHFVLALILVFALARVGVAARRIILTPAPNCFSNDYRATTAEIGSVLNPTDSRLEQVDVYAGGAWRGRNLLFQLWFAKKYANFLPGIKVTKVQTLPSQVQGGSKRALLISSEDAAKQSISEWLENVAKTNGKVERREKYIVVRTD